MNKNIPLIGICRGLQLVNIFLGGKLKKLDVDNKEFVANAPENIVSHEQNKKNRYEKEINILKDNLSSLK